jgi:dipeptidyl aminopeptidase/acylaminoacyl peptidase
MTRFITAEDLWSLARVGQPEPGPDGSFAVVPVTTYGDDGEATTRLYRVGIDGTTWALTADSASSTAPAVSADGGRVAFLRTPGDAVKPQLHVMRLDGGEPECLTDLPLGIIGMKWLPDDSGVIAIVPLLRGFGSVDATTDERDRRGGDPRPVVTEDRMYRYWNKWLAGGEIHHLMRIGLDGTVTDLTPGFESVIAYEPTVGDVDLAPDGREVAFSAVVDLTTDRHQTALFTVPVAGGDVRRVTDEAVAHERRPRYSPDGASLLFGVQPEWDFYADPIRLTLLDRASGETRRIASGWDRVPSGWEFIDEDSIVVGADDHGRTRIYRLSRDHGEPTPLHAVRPTHGARPAGGRIWARTESLTRPPEVIELDTGLVTGFNDALMAELRLGEVEEIVFPGADGAPVQAYIVYPPDFDPDRRWPLVHDIHGGPHGATGDDWHWRWNSQVFAAGGYVVVAVNFHGSFGWGDDFTRSIRGAWGDKPGADILAATDQLLARGFIDDRRMAIAGGSYGGYLVSWLTAVTDRFAAAICHAGVTDLLGQWASDITAGREKAVGGVPWESMDDVQRWSPMAHTHTMKTPTLIIHGELDYRVVVTQGLVLYGVLKAKGVPARLVYYADEGHWIEQRSNSLHWYGEFAAWLERWIGRGAT